MEIDKSQRKLWEHPDPKDTQIWKFMQKANAHFGLNMQDFDALYDWSCKNRADFNGFLWEDLRLIQEGSYTKVVDESVPINELPKWFEGVRVNWVENFLWKRGPNDGPGTRGTFNKEDDRIALTEIREGISAVRSITWKQLRDRVGEVAAALKHHGLNPGDRVVVVGANSFDTLVIFAATIWIGGMMSLSSTDMGVNGILQRTVQINPKFLFFDDGALYNGHVLDLREKIKGVTEGLRQCDQFQRSIVIQRFDKPYDTSSIPNTQRLEAFVSTTPDLTPPPIVRLGFQEPMAIFYSSGTTGIPKAIVHGGGTTLISAFKHATLHRNQTHNEVALQYTTTGWIMYMSNLSSMLLGARCILYDGSPFMPDHKVLLKIIETQKVTMLGISPRWMSEMIKNNIVPREVADLSSLEVVVSTGMVLPDVMFDWFYDVGFPRQVLLANIAGGTDIAGCFVMDNPLKPLYRGGFMGPVLGVPIAIYDHDMDEGSVGKEVPVGMPGDLVATGAFPNVPLFLWDDGPVAPGKKYNNAYFARFQGVWTQGDFCQIDAKTGGLHMLGRSDGVLNPSGIRFGSSDIYSVIEHSFPKEVAESLCVGQRRPQDHDERVVLFLIMKPGYKLDRKMVLHIKDVIAKALTKRHVPKYIFETPEIPTTVNGKKVELPVKKIISGEKIKPSGTLLNPQSLDFYYRFQKIEEIQDPQAKL